MPKTDKPVIAGILAIIAGAIGLIWAIILFFGFLAVSGAMGFHMGRVPVFVPFIVLAWAIPFLILSLLSLVGGVYSLQRRIWGVALAGAIAGILIFFPLGIATTVLVVLSRNEFEQLS